MRITIFPALVLLLGILGGCEDKERNQTISREHEMKATLMCQHDKGLKRVLDTNGKSFTAECKSRIIVTGSLD